MTNLFMKTKSLDRITESLKRVLHEIRQEGLHDRDVRHRYAEYLVARILSKKYSVQLLDEREVGSADIYLPDIEKRVEVKSCLPDRHDGCWYASFGKGTQISRNKCDRCVLVTFDGAGEDHRGIFVFTKEELEEVKTVRHGLAGFEHSNPCLLMYAPTLKTYHKFVKEYGVKAFEIEEKLNRHPEEFKNAWGKIE
jgi:hypothetical protein